MIALRKILKFKRAQEGLAFLEFAVCTPFLLILLMGAIEVSRYILIAQKVEKATMTISDVVGQGQTITSTQISSIITAAAQIMEPYTFSSNGYVIITSVTQTGTYSASNPPIVNWQYAGGGTWTQSSQVGTKGLRATLPTGLVLNDKDNVIVTEVYYNYTPILATNGVITGGTIYKVSVYKPRLGALNTLGMLLPPEGIHLWYG